ncbi:MAG: CBS domain-containing protein [Candidatus Nanohaloarchaea archaeon]|nr:CBS domain-containing protein [Candidatus Nanohaloarchaea archaeon]
MTSAKEISAEGIATTDFVTVEHEQPLTKVKAKMEEHNLREIPVVDGRQFKGMVSYTDIIDKTHSNPKSVTAAKVMRKPPEIDPDMNLVELARLRKDSGHKRFVMTENNQLEAVIGEEEMVFSLLNDVEELQNIRVEDLINRDVISLQEDDKHEKVLKKMQEHTISRVPITDSNGKLTGIISSHDALRSMIVRQQMDSGDVKGEKDDLSDIPCRELLNPNVTTISDLSLSIDDAIRQMKEHGTRELIHTDEDGRPSGILTLKDIIDFIASLEEQDAILVNIIGAEEEIEKQQIMDKLETAVQGRLGRLLDRPRELTLHVKHYKKDGGEHKYSLHAKLFSELGTTMAKDHGWDLQNALDDVIEKLAERVKEAKERERDRQRQQNTRGRNRG